MAGWVGDKTGRDPATELNELRRSVAQLLGEDEETWPQHGNAPLAIAASCALWKQRSEDARADAESARRECERVRERVIDLSQGVTDRGHGLCWWCCDAPYRGGDSPHREDCFLTGPEGLLSLFSGAALSGEDPPEVMG